MRNYFIIVFMLLILATAVSADSMLEFDEITIKVDGDKQSADEGGGLIKVPPGADLSMKIKVANLFTDEDDIEIENVEVEVEIFDIDDGDDMDETSDDKDIRTEDDETFNIDFEIPLRLDHDDTFEMTVTATGEDDEGVDHEVSITFDVEADKETHEIRVLRKEATPQTISCTKRTTLLIELINVGENDEDVEFSIENSELDISYQEDFEMVEDIDDDENEYRYEKSLDLSDAKVGTYPIDLIAKYRDGREVIDETISLIIEPCAADTPKPAPKVEPEPEPKVTQPEPKVTQPVQPQVVYTQPTAPTSANTAVAQPASSRASVATPKTNYSSTWWSRNKWIVLIVVADLILLIIGIAVILAILKRRRD
ncbi:hypothetical protein ACFL0V_00185 [Nanoarchaeota archaeon]